MAKRSSVWLGTNAVMLLGFALCVLLQVNDPDPIRWMVLYGCAAVACGLELAGRGRRALPVLAAVAAVAWAAALAPAAFTHDVRVGDLFADMRMKSAGVEEAREMLGLLIVAGWMVVLAGTAHRRVGRLKGKVSALPRDG